MSQTGPVSGAEGIITDRNRLIAVGIALVILAIFSSVAFRLPEASTRIVGSLTVGSVIKIGIAVVMLVILTSTRGRLTRVITYYARSIFKVEQLPSRARVSGEIGGLSTELSNVIVIAIAWPLAVEIVRRLLRIDPSLPLGWITILVTLGFVALLLYRLYIGYQRLEPVLAVVGKPSQDVPCPKCRTLNLVTAKFCTSCGAELQPATAQGTAPDASVHCAKCGAENSPGAKFCQSCGSPIATGQSE